VLKTIGKQDTKIAEELGAKELGNASAGRFDPSEEGLQKEVDAAFTTGQYRPQLDFPV